MIGYVLTAGSGLNIEDGRVTGLSDASALRADTAVQVYTGEADALDVITDATEFHFAGAYPRLPKGMTEVALADREAVLMQQRAVSQGLPEGLTSTEPHSTSTVENVIHTMRQITGVHMPDTRDIARFIRPDHKLAFIASESQLPRLASAFIKMGGMQEAIEFIPTAERARHQDRLNRVIHKAGMLLVPRGDTARLERIDNVLESGNDTLHHAAGSAISTARTVKKLFRKP